MNRASKIAFIAALITTCLILLTALAAVLITFDVIELSLPLTAIITRELPHHVFDPPLILLRLANHCPFPFLHEANRWVA